MENEDAQKGIMDLACLVQITGLDPKLVKAKSSPFYKADDGLTTLSASGMVFPEKGLGVCQRKQTVLCSASTIWSFLREEYRHNLETASHGDLLPETEITIIMDSRNINCTSETGPVNASGNLLGFLKVLKIPQVESSSNYVGWDLINISPLPVHAQQKLAEFVALIEIERSPDQLPSGVLWGRGDPDMEVYVIGSPFGCVSSHHFINCLVHGNLVNSARKGKASEYLSVSGYLLPGMEGGVVISRTSQMILGMLSLLVNGEPLLIPMDLIFEAVCKWATRHKQPGVVKPWELHTSIILQCPPQQHLQSDLGRGIVKLRTPSGTWGSGVVINEKAGIVVTCSHLFQQSTNTSKTKVVSIFYPGLGWSTGTLIYRFIGFLDVAVVYIPKMPSILQAAKMWNGDYRSLPGRACYAVGFGSEQQQSHAEVHTVHGGNIAKAVYHPTKKDECLMLINAVGVFPGSSGGALFLPSGHLVGLITGNTMHSEGQSIPHCSFSIPMCLLRDIYEYQWDQDINKWASNLGDLDADDEQSSLIWRLLAPNPHPKRVLPGGKAFKAFMERLRTQQGASERTSYGHVSKL